MGLKNDKRSKVIFVNCNESRVSEVKRTETCWTNYPVCKAHRDIPPKAGGVQYP